MLTRYARIRFIGVLQNFINTAELIFYDRNFNRIANGSGTALGSAIFPGFPHSNGFDQNTATLVSQNFAIQPCFLGFDFGALVDIKYVRHIRELNNNNIIYGYEIDISPDGVNWTYTGFFNPVGGSNNESVITFAEVEPLKVKETARYWRIAIMASQSVDKGASAAVSALKFLDKDTDLHTVGAPINYPSSGGFPVANAFDNNINTLWSAPGTDNPPYLLGFDFQRDVSPNKISITARNDGFLFTSVKRLVVQNSSNNLIWNSFASIDNIPAFSLGETKTFDIAKEGFKSVTYRRYAPRMIPGVSYFIERKMKK